MHLCEIPEEAMNQLHLPNGLPLVSACYQCLRVGIILATHDIMCKILIILCFNAVRFTPSRGNASPYLMMEVERTPWRLMTLDQPHNICSVHASLTMTSLIRWNSRHWSIKSQLTNRRRQWPRKIVGLMVKYLGQCDVQATIIPYIKLKCLRSIKSLGLAQREGVLVLTDAKRRSISVTPPG